MHAKECVAVVFLPNGGITESAKGTKASPKSWKGEKREESNDRGGRVREPASGYDRPADRLGDHGHGGLIRGRRERPCQVHDPEAGNPAGSRIHARRIPFRETIAALSAAVRADINS